MAKIDIQALAKQAGMSLEGEAAEAQLKLFTMLVMKEAATIARDTSDAMYHGNDPYGQKGAMKMGRSAAGDDIIYAVTQL